MLFTVLHILQIFRVGQYSIYMGYKCGGFTQYIQVIYTVLANPTNITRIHTYIRAQLLASCTATARLTSSHSRVTKPPLWCLLKIITCWCLLKIITCWCLLNCRPMHDEHASILWLRVLKLSHKCACVCTGSCNAFWLSNIMHSGGDRLRGISRIQHHLT